MYADLMNELVVFMLDIKLWSGRKVMRPEDLVAGGINPQNLPPESLASLGSKRIVGKDALSTFSALKREAEKLCLSIGTRFLGGYAVPKGEAEQLQEQLEQIKEKFYAEHQRFCQHYDQDVDAWIAENPPQWSPIIRASVEPVSSVARALQFSYAAVTVTAPEGISSAALEEKLGGLLGQLCHEVRQQAKTAYLASFHNKDKVTRKALRPLQAIRKKLSGLVFLDPLVSHAVLAIDQTLDRLPATGPIGDHELNLLAGLLGRHLAQLGDPQPEAGQDDLPPDVDPLVTGPVCCGSSALAWDF